MTLRREMRNALLAGHSLISFSQADRSLAMTILGWDQAFHQLWTHAMRHRGADLDAQSERQRDGMAQGWPRTRGSDVLAIAAVVDPVVRALPMESGSFGIQRRWHYCAADLADLALDRPDHEYTLNPAFWATLAATFAHLASTDAPVPHQLWRALLTEIGGDDDRALPREDQHHLAGDSYEELWRIQKARLSELRGVEVRAPSGAGGPRMTVPRTTNRDILQLATFWTLALIKVEHKRAALGPALIATLGLDGVKRRWNAVLADVDMHARNGDPADVYPRNHELWRATASVSVTLSAIDDMPLSLDLRVSRGPAEHRNARTYEMKEATFGQTWTAQHDQLAKARGCDLREPPAGTAGGPMHIPRTTNTDIRELAAYWNAAWIKLEDAWRHGDVLDRIADPVGLTDERTRWQAAMADVDKLARTGNPTDIYAKNHELWRASQSLAITLDRHHQRPIPSGLTLDVPEESLPERILDFVKELPGQIAEAAGAVAYAVGRIGREAGAGFFDGLGVPILVGAGGIVALWLLLRRTDHPEDA
jgi:hypothetical protein